MDKNLHLSLSRYNTFCISKPENRLQILSGVGGMVGMRRWGQEHPLGWQCSTDTHRELRLYKVSSLDQVRFNCRLGRPIPHAESIIERRDVGFFLSYGRWIEVMWDNL